MGIRVKTTFTSRLSKSWLSDTVKKAESISLEMATDVHRQATILAPRDSGDLIASGRVEKTAEGYEVSFGGKSGVVDVRYAKRRHYENNKNPQTLGYLERAGENVSRDKQKYFRNAL